MGELDRLCRGRDPCGALVEAVVSACGVFLEVVEVSGLVFGVYIINSCFRVEAYIVFRLNQFAMKGEFKLSRHHRPGRLEVERRRGALEILILDRVRPDYRSVDLDFGDDGAVISVFISRIFGAERIVLKEHGERRRLGGVGQVDGVKLRKDSARKPVHNVMLSLFILRHVFEDHLPLDAGGHLEGRIDLHRAVLIDT